jgi:hypothetical protein
MEVPKMDMTVISECSMSNCAYNKEGSCHTLGITVGPHAECNTYVHHSTRGGFPGVQGGIGACLASSCQFNDKLECKADEVDVTSDDKHADCATFKKK